MNAFPSAFPSRGEGAPSRLSSVIPEALILAAGNGTRLSPVSALPKPLVPVAGRPLIEHVLSALARASVRRVHVVTGYQGAAIRHHVESTAGSEQLHRLEIGWLDNPAFDRPNGLSLLVADGRVRPPFLLLMADHLFEVRTLQRFLGQPAPAGGGLLAVDSKVGQVFDLPDATKVRSQGGDLDALGKDVSPYNAIDTGMFQFDAAIFEAMRLSAARGEESLTAGVSELARRHTMRTWDIGDAEWIDVDTPMARRRAERLVLEGRLG